MSVCFAFLSKVCGDAVQNDRASRGHYSPEATPPFLWQASPVPTVAGLCEDDSVRYVGLSFRSTSDIRTRQTLRHRQHEGRRLNMARRRNTPCPGSSLLPAPAGRVFWQPRPQYLFSVGGMLGRASRREGQTKQCQSLPFAGTGGVQARGRSQFVPRDPGHPGPFAYLLLL